MIIICRQLQDLNMRQHHKEQFQLLRDIQQLEGGISFILELPNTLTHRIIAQHPKISGKLLDYAKSHGVQIHFTEAEFNIKATLTGIPDAFEDVQTNLVSLDHQLQEMLSYHFFSTQGYQRHLQILNQSTMLRYALQTALALLFLLRNSSHCFNQSVPTNCC